MPLHPQVAAYVEEMKAKGRVPASEMSLEQIRRAYREVSRQAGPAEEVARVRDLEVPGPGGEIPIRIYSGTAEDSLPMVMYFHGGGFIKGDLETHDPICRALANRAGCLVVAVDYRLAPEHRHPAALDDSFTATQWVRAHCGELGGDSSKMAVCGDSAGGWLAAQVAIKARDRNGPQLACQVLVYPHLDLSLSRPSQELLGRDYLTTKQSLAWYIKTYLEPGTDLKDPVISPLFLKDLTGLPQTLIIGAEYDPLVDEGRAYGERLKRAGVAVKYGCFKGAIHGFFQLGGIMDQGREAIDLAGVELKSALGK